MRTRVKYSPSLVLLILHEKNKNKKKTTVRINLFFVLSLRLAYQSVTIKLSTIIIYCLCCLNNYTFISIHIILCSFRLFKKKKETDWMNLTQPLFDYLQLHKKKIYIYFYVHVT